MDKKIKIALLGVGRIGSSMANKNLPRYPELFEIVAVCDLIKERRESVAEKYSCNAYANYEDMLKQENIELVYIATRSCDHYKHAVQALDAGKHVLLEKPATISYEEALALYARASEKGSPRLFIRQQRRLEGAFSKVFEVVNSGKLGKVFEVNIQQNTFQHRDDWQTIDEFGGGQLLNWGPHIIDQSLQLLGTPTFDLQSYLCQETAGGNCEDHLHIRFIGNNNRVVNMSISGATALNIGRFYSVYGTRGACTYANGKLTLHYINPEQEIPPVVANPNTPGASFGKSGTFESKLVIDWINEEYDVEVEPEGVLDELLVSMYNAIRYGEEFLIKDEEVLSIMRTISAVKAQNKYIMK